MGKIPDHRRGLGAFFVPSSILASELHGDRGGEVGIVKVFFWGVLFLGGFQGIKKNCSVWVVFWEAFG